MSTRRAPEHEPGAAGPLAWAVATAPYPGESVSGDVHVVRPFSGGVLLAVVDALGHGQEAAATARAAADTLTRYAQEPVGSVLRRCHDALARTRGAVVGLASLDVAATTVTWLGVGNVEGVLLPANPSERGRAHLIPLRGTVGADLPQARPELLRVAAGDTLVFATDGIRSEFAEAPLAKGTPQQVADTILSRYGKGTDDALVLVARYVGDGPSRP